MSLSSNFSNAEVNILILNFLEFKFQGNTFTSDFNNNFIKSIDVKDEIFVILDVISWCKHDRNLK